MNDALVCFILDRIFIAFFTLWISSVTIFIISSAICYLEELKDKKVVIASFICSIIFGIAIICTPQGDDYLRIKEIKKPVIEQPKPQPPKPSTTKPAGSIEEI